MGRFINADAYASTGQGILGNNMFAYCGNNSVNFCDPTGQYFCHPKHNPAYIGDDGTGGSGGGEAGGSAALWGLAYLLEEGKRALVSLGALLALVQTSLAYDSDHGEYYVYVLTDKDQNIQYVGRTKNPDARERAHSMNPARADLSFHIVGYNLTYTQVRGLEQALMLYCHTIDKTNSQNNQINGISPNNRSIEDYIKAAQGALGYSWNQFSNEVLCWLGQ